MVVTIKLVRFSITVILRDMFDVLFRKFLKGIIIFHWEYGTKGLVVVVVVLEYGTNEYVC